MFRKILRSPVTTVVLFVIAAGLLLTATIGGTRAALNIISKDWVAEIQLDSIAVALTESNEAEGANPKVVAWNRPLNDNEKVTGRLLTNLIPEGEEFKLETVYPEYLGAANIGAIPEYIRVSVLKYWVKDGKKAVDLDPSLIDLHYVTDTGWTIDEDASTDERTVLYYKVGPVEPGQQVNTPPLTDTLKISKKAAKGDYVGAYPYIQAFVDGVQNHNAAKAITSAWGHNFLGIAEEK